MERGGSTKRIETEALAPPPPLFVPPELSPTPAPSTIVTSVPAYPIVQPQPVRIRQPYPVIGSPSAGAQPVVPITNPVAPPIFAPESAPQTVPVSTPPTAALTEPAIVFDAGSDGSTGLTARPEPSTGAPSTPDNGEAKNRAPQSVHLVRLRNPSTTVPTGTLIRATLETPIDTSRPGFARAVVSKDTRGFNGTRILIPRGSRLIGEYASDARAGQNRVLLNWTQLLRPDGSMMRLDSPAADATGGAGVPGRAHSFFFQRFINALLQTAMNVGGNLAAYSNRTPLIVGIPNTAVTNVVGQTQFISQDPQPKITVKQGAALTIFVARDLDFSAGADRSEHDPDGR